jgi:hypothetical protein
MAGKNTGQAIVKFSIIHIYNKKKYINLAKAFDTIDHLILLHNFQL